MIARIWLALVGAGLSAIVSIGVQVLTSRRLLRTQRARATLTHWGGYATIVGLVAIINGLLVWRLGEGVTLVAAAAFTPIGMMLAAVDLLERRLPNALTAAGAGIALALAAGVALTEGSGATVQRAAVSSAIAGGFYLVVAVVSHGGLGAGDVKLGALIGLQVGLVSVHLAIVAMLVGLTIAAITGLIVPVISKTRRATFPLGPALVTGALLTIGLLAS